MTKPESNDRDINARLQQVHTSVGANGESYLGTKLAALCLSEGNDLRSNHSFEMECWWSK
jgi:hypothetical protein